MGVGVYSTVCILGYSLADLTQGGVTRGSNKHPLQDLRRSTCEVQAYSRTLHSAGSIAYLSLPRKLCIHCALH